MVVTFGYRPSEQGIVLSSTETPDVSYKMTTQSSSFNNTDRAVMRRSLGCHVEGFALPVPDVNYAPDQAAGAIKRVAAQMPKINRVKLRKFKRFVKRWCVKYLTPFIFRKEDTFDFEEWIENSPYPLYRKNELRKVYEKSLNNPMICKVLSFIKDENYPEYKHMRGIYSRHDDYKVRVGPFFKKLGDIIFNLKWFIKKIPVNDRPKAMLDKFGDCSNLFCTDFSQFEATFVKQLMSVEQIVYRFILKDHPMQKEILDTIVKGMMSTNFIQFYNWSMKLMCKRMSGEMNTSVSNGFMNLLLTHFLLEEAGNKMYDGYFEGDDSINSYDVRAPTASEYEEMGAKIKIEFPRSLCEASFCGQIFDPVDLDNVVNPCEALVSFGWTGRQYLCAGKNVLLKLLKAKSLSLLYEYSGCPILRNLALYGLRMTNNFSMHEVDRTVRKSAIGNYKQEQWLELLDNYDEVKCFNNNVKDNTRILVSNIYGLSVNVQLEIEKYLDNKNDLSPLILPQIYSLVPYCWNSYFQTYSMVVDNPRNIHDIPQLVVSSGYRCRYYKNKDVSILV